MSAIKTRKHNHKRGRERKQREEAEEARRQREAGSREGGRGCMRMRQHESVQRGADPAERKRLLESIVFEGACSSSPRLSFFDGAFAAGGLPAI